MGNTVSDQKYNIQSAIHTFNSIDEPNYPYSIEIDSFTNTNDLREKILAIEHMSLYKNFDKIMFVLHETINSNSKKTMCQTDYFLFRHHNKPIFKIHNTSAQMNKWLRNTNPEMNLCIVCDIEKIKKDDNTFANLIMR